MNRLLYCLVCLLLIVFSYVPSSAQNPELAAVRRGSIVVFPYYNTGATTAVNTWLHLTTDDANTTRVNMLILSKQTGAYTLQYYACITKDSMANVKLSDYVGQNDSGMIVFVTVDSTSKPLPASNHLSGVATITRSVNGVAKEFTYQAYNIQGFNQLDSGTGQPATPVLSVNSGSAWQISFDGHSYEKLPSKFRFPAKNVNQNPELIASTIPANLTQTGAWPTTSCTLNVNTGYNSTIINTSRSFPIGLAYNQTVNGIGWVGSYNFSTNAGYDANNLRLATNVSNIPVLGLLLFTGYQGGVVWQGEPEGFITATMIIPQTNGTTC